MDLFILLFPGAVAYHAGKAVVKARASRNWPTVPGTVVRTDKRTFDIMGAEFVVPVVEYQYSIGEQKHTSTTVRYGFEGKMVFFDYRDSWADTVLREYSVGTAVNVHHHPQNPSRSTLNTDVSKGVRESFQVCAIMLFNGLLLLGWKKPLALGTFLRKINTFGAAR
jgi:hypothetical protein